MNHEQYQDRVKALLYLLMRDKMPSADVVTIVNEVEQLRNIKEHVYTAKGLEEYASELADRMLRAPDGQDDMGVRVECQLCWKAIEGGNKRDSSDWCDCIRCEHCGERMRLRGSEEKDVSIQTLCDRCYGNGARIDANGRPYLLSDTAKPPSAVAPADEAVDVPSLQETTGQRFLYLASGKTGALVCPCDGNDLKQVLRRETAGRVREIWPDHGHGPEWRMASTVMPPDEGVMVLDLAAHGRACTVDRLKQLGLWPHGARWGE